MLLQREHYYLLQCFSAGIADTFEVTPLSGIEYATILGLAITPTIFIQGYKFITSKKERIC